MGAQVSKRVVVEGSKDIKLSPSEPWSVVAWGQNNCNQCGVEPAGLLLQPRRVQGLPEGAIAGLHAGHRHSSLITEAGEVFTWGRNNSGELGLGRWSSCVPRPAHVSAFEGHDAISTVSIGHDHAVYIDRKGGLWSGGSNAYGQLGLGTPLPSRYAQNENGQRSAAGGSAPVVVMKRQIDSRLQRMGLPSVATGESVAPYLVGIPPTVQKQRELGLADSHHSVDDKTAQANNVEAAALGLRDYTDLMEWNGLGGAEMHSPARLGQDIEDVLRLRVGQTPPRRAVSFPEVHFDMLRRNSGRNSDFLELLSAVPGHPQQQGAAQQSFPRSVNPNTPASALPFVPSLPPAGTLFSNPLHEQVVTSVAASRDFTLVATAEGEVWTFGCGKDHQLGTGNYVQTDPRPVSGRVARIVAENGGAVDVAAGEAFCLALARNGSVVMWGRHALEGLVCNSTRGLPGMVRIAAGRKHAVLSDGESIWHCTLGPSPQHPGFDKPTRLTWQGSLNGVAKLAAGGDASAVIDLDGTLWMWGRLADATQAGTMPPAKSASGSAALPCFNTFERNPVRISNLDKVQHVALGSNHVLAAMSR